MIDAIRVPVYDRDGQIILYDLYVEGEWIGSRRTSAQCDEAIKSERRNKFRADGTSTSSKRKVKIRTKKSRAAVSR